MQKWYSSSGVLLKATAEKSVIWIRNRIRSSFVRILGPGSYQSVTDPEHCQEGDRTPSILTAHIHRQQLCRGQRTLAMDRRREDRTQNILSALE
jgi:hypothetical protein